MKNGILASCMVLFFLYSITANSKVPPTITKEITLEAFERVALDNAFDVTIKYGLTQKVTISGSDKIIDNIDFKIKNKMLVLDMKKHHRQNHRLKVEVIIPRLTEVQVNGSGSANFSNFPNFSNLVLEAHGSGDIDADEALVINNNLKIIVSGSGSINIGKGTAKRSEVMLDGSGSYEGRLLETNSTEVAVSGSGDATVHATNHLEAKVTGSGSIYYKGNPNKVESHSDGSGDVESL